MEFSNTNSNMIFLLKLINSKILLKSCKILLIHSFESFPDKINTLIIYKSIGCKN